MKPGRREVFVDDDFGNRWLKCWRETCALEVVRPGKAQCVRCERLVEEPWRPLAPALTEADIRRIVREEIARAKAGK